VGELNAQVKELKLNVEALERERDFYFGKLRDVEILLQTYGGADKELVDKMFKILYATEEDFVTVDVSWKRAPSDAIAHACLPCRKTAMNFHQRKLQHKPQPRPLPTRQEAKLPRRKSLRMPTNRTTSEARQPNKM